MGWGRVPKSASRRLLLYQQVALSSPQSFPHQATVARQGHHLAFPGPPPGCRPGAPADTCLSGSLLCQDAGGEVLRVTAGHPPSPSRGDCVSTQASAPALHPGPFTAEAT